jgi:hypothetical protein
MTAIGDKKANRWHLQIAGRWIVQYNFYVNDRQWGRMFVRMCPYLPFSARICLNQHHWLANRMREEGIDFQKCSNAFRRCAAPTRLQELAASLTTRRPRPGSEHHHPLEHDLHGRGAGLASRRGAQLARRGMSPDCPHSGSTTSTCSVATPSPCRTGLPVASCGPCVIQRSPAMRRAESNFRFRCYRTPRDESASCKPSLIPAA